MKIIIKKLFSLFGIHLSRLNVVNVPGYQTVQALKTNNINVVFDIGANIGQFASELREHGYEGKIISFEPLQEAYNDLIIKARSDRNWIVHPRCAVGAMIGEVEMNVAANSASSSILPMLALHEDAAPDSKYTHKETVPLITLDSVSNFYATPQDNVFIKIDTQGYEWTVLDGAEDTIKKSKGILLELSLVPLYEGQKLWQDLVSRLGETNHTLFAIQPCFTDIKTGRTLQLDGLFFDNDK